MGIRTARYALVIKDLVLEYVGVSLPLPLARADCRVFSCTDP